MFSDYLVYSSQTTPTTQHNNSAQFDDLWKATQPLNISITDFLYSNSITPIVDDNYSIPSYGGNQSPANSTISTTQLFCQNNATSLTPSLVSSSPTSAIQASYPYYSPPPDVLLSPINLASPLSFCLPTSPNFEQPVNIINYEAENVDDRDFSLPPSPTPTQKSLYQIQLGFAEQDYSPIDVNTLLSKQPINSDQTTSQVSQEDFDENPAIVLSEFPDGDRPNCTYARLLIVAIKRSPKQKLLLDQIYDIFIQKYRAFKWQKDSKGWQNSIRHNLSLYACFHQQARGRDEKGRGKYWLVELVFSLIKTPQLTR